MLYKIPQPDPTKVTGTGRWSSEYTLFLANELYPLTCTIIHAVPNFEVLDMNVDMSDALKEHHHAEYVQQIAVQQCLTEFREFAEKSKMQRTTPKPYLKHTQYEGLFDEEK